MKCSCIILSVMICTSAGFPAGQLELDASVELQGDEAVRRHHEDPGDEEEQQQQRHVPGRGAASGKERQRTLMKKKPKTFIVRASSDNSELSASNKTSSFESSLF